VCMYFCSPEKFQVSDILCKMVSNCMIEELNFCAVYNVGTARDDEQIEAHSLLRNKVNVDSEGIPAKDSGILLQVQAPCY
jgi:hypothetical protein